MIGKYSILLEKNSLFLDISVKKIIFICIVCVYIIIYTQTSIGNKTHTHTHTHTHRNSETGFY